MGGGEVKVVSGEGGFWGLWEVGRVGHLDQEFRGLAMEGQISFTIFSYHLHHLIYLTTQSPNVHTPTHSRKNRIELEREAQRRW